MNDYKITYRAIVDYYDHMSYPRYCEYVSAENVEIAIKKVKTMHSNNFSNIENVEVLGSNNIKYN